MEISDARLEAELSRLLAEDVSLESRQTSPYGSTHHLEKVTLSSVNGTSQLMCKYGPDTVDALTGHRRGNSYEWSIYSRVFPDPDLSTPVCHGLFRVDESTTCLVLAHVSGNRVHNAAEPATLVDVCRDLGRFHSRGVRSLPRDHNTFGRSHFSKLVSEMELLPGVSPRLQGLGSVVVNTLSNAPRTIVHGELYPRDVLISEQGPVVIDWESAGNGPGVFDFAVLTQGSWDAGLVDECEEAYWGVRSDSRPPWAAKNLAAARIMAAGLLLIHLRGRQTDGLQEEIALNTIATQGPELGG